MKTIHVAVAGLGRIGKIHLKNLARNFSEIRVLAVMDVLDESRQIAEEFNVPVFVKTYDELLQVPDLDAVVICSPTDTHADYVIKAAEAGKHIFCEKPLDLSLERVKEVLDVVRESGVQLMLGFNRRFAPLAQNMMDFIEDRSEPLVAHYRVNAGYIPLTHWLHDIEIGGGRIIGEGCHFVDFLAFLVGAAPVSVTATGMPDAGQYCEDNVVMTFSFPDGSVGTVSYLANGDKTVPKERIEVFAGGRVAVLDDFRSLEMVRDGQRQLVRSRLRQDKGHQAAWEAFRDAIKDGKTPPIPYDQLFGVTYATFAAVEALRGKQTVFIN